MRRVPALLIAALTVLALASPAAAQEASPSPSPSPTPTPSRTPSPPVSCPGVDITDVQTDRRVGGVTTVTARRYGGPPDTRMTLHRIAPAPQALVREQSDTATTVIWTLRLGETHRVQIGAIFDRSQCVPLGRPDQMPVTIGIRADVSIAAVRNAVRDYTFSGRVVPARGQTVDLLRVETDGRRLLTSRGAVAADGTYRIDRRFTNSGRFGFVAMVPTSQTNDTGSSPVRPTVIH